MTPSTDAVKAAMEKAGYHANVSAVMAILQAAYDVDVDSLRAENARLREALKPFAVLNDSADPRILGDTGMFAIPLRDLRAARAAMGESDG